MAEKVFKSINLLPEFFRTEKNSKFLSSTIDQLIQPPSLERIDGFIGSTITSTYDANKDLYIQESTELRKNYQLDPALIVKDNQGKINDVIGIDDLTNEIAIKGGSIENFNRLYKSEFFSYDPRINWDKFVNFQEYYWLVNGPETITISGTQLNTTSTFSVKDSIDGTSFIFGPDGVSEDPLVILYRGNTYTFDVESQYNFYIKTFPSLGDSDQYNVGVTNNGTNNGKITIVVDENTPSTLFYTSNDQQNTQGRFAVKNIQEDSIIDVEEIIGKKYFVSGAGINLSNGMKITFVGKVIPESYENKEFYVEGVGTGIQLVDVTTLSTSESMSEVPNENYDGTNFDSFPFDNFKTLPITPEYITINRASCDLNPWSRYNRWFHKDIIEISAKANGLPEANFPEDKKARRPIIEFAADLKLYNFGSYGIPDVDLIDTVTTDAFSLVEGSAGHYVDETFLEKGFRVIFAADEDILVRSKIYEVNFLTIDGNLRLQLIEVDSPRQDSVVSVTKGRENKGTSWWYNGDKWNFGQQHVKLNQPPLFDVFDDKEQSYSDPNYRSSFKGTKIFGYEEGSGTPDPILGFPLKYKNSLGLGSFTFKNYFNTETITVINDQNQAEIVSIDNTFLRFTGLNNNTYKNVWEKAKPYQLPIIEQHYLTQSTSTVEIVSIDNPTKVEFTVEAYINNSKLISQKYEKINVGTQSYIVFDNPLPVGTNLFFKIYSPVAPNQNGYYELPLGAVNNPFNGSISILTLSEVSDHVKSMIERSDDFVGQFPGPSNIRDISNLSTFGSKLIANLNSLAFAQMFIGKKENNLLNAITAAGDQYNQFKLALLTKIQAADYQLAPSMSLDLILKELNADKDILSSWYSSDMLAYGTDKNQRSWTIDGNFTVFPISNVFSLNEISDKSVLIYVNSQQLLYGKDYLFVENDPAVEILTELTRGDILTIVEYTSTAGSFVPSTPTKLGLYPKYLPSKFLDTSYIDPVNVIQGHDGSLMVAYNDFRDDILLEFEKRIYNNCKVVYRQELYDVNAAVPGAFRSTEYSRDEVNQILSKDFVKWCTAFNIDPNKNNSFEEDNPWTYNYTNSFNPYLGKNLFGSWRALYIYLYDTDRPQSCPWEMLGFSQQPSWWEELYGPHPYTSNNLLLWEDIKNGIIRQGNRKGTYAHYARPGLFNFLPVDEDGNLVDPSTFAINLIPFNIRQNWKFGDLGPAEASWRRSSHWPFIVQKFCALTNPASYAALMYNPFDLEKNLAGQWISKQSKRFLSIKDITVQDEDNQISGYSVYVAEIGSRRRQNYRNELRSNLSNSTYNLFYKVGGFVSKDKLQILIDAVDPTSSSLGALLPSEDYELILNISNPIRSSSISGIIVQKESRKFLIKGYDVSNPYFNVLPVIRNSITPSITVGGISESFVEWQSSTSANNAGLNPADITSASQSINGIFYEEGQLVRYGNQYYRVKVRHRSENTFNPDYFTPMPFLPIKGGATVQRAADFEKQVVQIPYDQEFDNIQDVYDVIIGYGAWLETQGFIFDEYNKDLTSVLNWEFSGKEFLYWTTQNWAINSIITLSPFADKIKFKFPNTVVDNILDNFYEYSVLQANGNPFPRQNLSVNRENGLCAISVTNNTEGIYFATIHSVQKEHAMVFNNTTMFGDTIYDVETGYRQRRMRLTGFRTSNWDGDFFSPGFVYDTASISDWKTYTDYKHGDVVKFAGKYFTAKSKVEGSEKFDFGQWILLGEKPIAALLPNFDYKIKQFEDFYSLDIDNFDLAQQKMAQHLIGYTPRVYLNNIFTNPIAQYKFYQGFIKEKGTKNAVTKLAKATIQNLQGELTFKEEWAFRVGHFGSFESFKEIETRLPEIKFIENPQVIKFTDDLDQPINTLIYYSTGSDRLIVPDGYVPSNTFVTTSSLELIKLETAGFVRFDDVNYTAYNEDSILDIQANGLLKEGDLIWIGSKRNGDWDVFRYTADPARVIKAYMDPQATNQMIFFTKGSHSLTTGDLISISKFDDTLNGIYTVGSTPGPNSFTINLTSDVFIPGVETEIGGLLFRFLSIKFENFDSISADSELFKLPVNTSIWINDDGQGKWAVYKKTNNYKDKSINASQIPEDQKLGWAITKKKTDNIFAVGSPNYILTSGKGAVSVYFEKSNTLRFLFRYGINSENEYVDSQIATNFGSALAYNDRNFNNTGFGLLFAGAPAASYVKSNPIVGEVNYATENSAASLLQEQGLVKISSVDPLLVEENTEKVLISPFPSNYERFGSSICQINNLLLVGAPQSLSIGNGTVYKYNVTTASGVVNLVYLGTITNAVLETASGSRYGHVISASDNADIIAVGAPGYNKGTGIVSIFSGTNTLLVQTIESPFEVRSKFGENLKVSPTGDYLFVAAPDARNVDQSYGKVAVYHRVNNTFVLEQIINNPVPKVGMKFGQAVDINKTNDELIVTAIGLNQAISATYDRYSELLEGSDRYVNDPDSLETSNDTSFDSASTKFFDKVEFSGTAYVYNRKNKLFRLAEELTPVNTAPGTNFGFSVAFNTNNIYIGAPSLSSSPCTDFLSTSSAFYQFYKVDTDAQSWKTLREQDLLVDIDTVQKIALIDSFKEEVIDYLDVIDPLKGRIAGLADQDLTWKSKIDPAVYTIGSEILTINADTNWLDEHVGELWWDLSTAKYVVYEQGDLIYRKNNWGKLFPGATIDVYEWIGSELLPSEWAALADTPEGLTRNISGQPKYPDNSVLSVKQVYNSINGSFVNYYYFWVRNKVLVPNIKNRRISAQQVAAIIENPTQYGIKYAAVLDNDSIALANVGDMLIGDRININITTDVIKNAIPRHTEWLLLQQGSPTSVPNSLLEKKLIDSLLGKDKLGNLVPDPSLSYRQKYGIGIRPRQSMFKDRVEALRNVIDFTNSVLKENQLTGNYSFKNLNAQEDIPSVYDREYDVIVEDIEALEIIDISQYSQGEISCSVENGKIVGVQIINPGFGYINPPKITIADNFDAELFTVIDQLGRIIEVEIKKAGNGFEADPQLTVRPFTVIVLSDSQSNGKWSKFIFDLKNRAWVRIQTQKFNTTLYWEYIDWFSPNFNKYKDYDYTIQDVYQLDTLEDILPGNYVKINNGGLGNFIIVEKLQSNQMGSFSNGYDVVFSENGTIKIKDTVWNYNQNRYGYDKLFAYDQTLYDQTPEIELIYIFQALKNDIFVNELKVNWNLLFFNAVKFALGEQKLLDWAFKTSFINVVNDAGLLDQRSTYKLQNSDYYEDYLKEVKPYHTKIRNFTTRYGYLEPTLTKFTDFDLPPYYDDESNKINVVEILASTPKSNFTLTETKTNLDPWKDWANNYTFSIQSISVGTPGAGYTLQPTVEIVPAIGDTGFGAEAKAYIRSGEVYEIEVTNPGRGYIKSPMVYILGGGDNITVQATAYANLYNGKVRSTTVGMRFDRISRRPILDKLKSVDRFVCDGSTQEFRLTWLSDHDKATFTVKLDGSLVLANKFTVRYDQEYVSSNKEYVVHFSKLVLLGFRPKENQILEVTYYKSVNLLDATERIEHFYEPGSGMPGKDLPQLMYGIEYPRVNLEALQFNYTTKWDLPYSVYGETAWEDDINFYFSTTLNNVTSTVGTTATLIQLLELDGVNLGQFVNVISTLTNAFVDNEVRVLSIDTLTNSIIVDSLTVASLTTGTKIEFWSYSNDLTILDTAIEGGSWTTGTRTLALGINPEDLTIVGDGFITPNTSYAPEELVPGEAHDTLAINVFTRNSEGAPTIIASSFSIQANTLSRYKLSITPPNSNSVFVNFNNEKLTYVSGEDFSSDKEFTFDWDTNELVISPQLTSGRVGYQVISIGGGRPTVEAGVLDNVIYTNVVGGTTQLVSLAGSNTVKSAYVTVNGISTNNFELVPANPGNSRAAVNVFDVPSGATVSAWFFGTAYKYFNEIKEQIDFLTISTSSTLFIDLLQPPEIIQPAAGQIIVELEDDQGTRILRPPNINYYQVTNLLIQDFEIKNDGVYDENNVRVFLNGVELRPGFDFNVILEGSKYKVKIAVNLRFNDVIAIESLPSTLGLLDYDYDVVGSTLKLLPLTSSTSVFGILRILTFTNHDDMLMRTERFNGTPIRRYKVSRTIINDNYVWVVVNGKPLTNRYDYVVLDDMRTIQVSDRFDHTSSDEIIITTVSSDFLSSTVLGYRIFNDILNRTHYKRLSKEDSTYLTKPLYFTDTEIHVADAKSLRKPNVEKNIPGVVLIDGERIEFFRVDGNILKQLRRSTLGTAPAFYCETLTKVMDQSLDQTVPFSDNIKRQSIFTEEGVTTYTISTVSSRVSFNTGTNLEKTIINDGIILSTQFNLEDQISVYYGGRLLRKRGIFVQDQNMRYDTLKMDLKNIQNISSIDLVQRTEVLGLSYLETSTNKVWVYENSLIEGSVKGFVYSGVNYLPPEFTLSKNTGTQSLSLLISQGIREGILISVVKKEFARTSIWNDQITTATTVSLMDSTTAIARFLQARPAELPDKYFYGGDPALTEETGFALQDENEKPLEDY